MSKCFNLTETLVAANREWKQLAWSISYSLCTAGDSLQKKLICYSAKGKMVSKHAMEDQGI